MGSTVVTASLPRCVRLGQLCCQRLANLAERSDPMHIVRKELEIDPRKV